MKAKYPVHIYLTLVILLSAVSVFSYPSSAMSWDSKAASTQDILGFDAENTFVNFLDDDSLGAAQPQLEAFGYAQKWRVGKHPRMMADVNGDGKQDIVGFGGKGVSVAFATGDDFGPARLLLEHFGYDQGWRVDKHPRMMADVNGDGKQAIVGFGVNGTYVLLSEGDGFGPWGQPLVPSAIDEGLRKEILKRLPIWESYAVRCNQHPSRFPTKGEPDKCDDGDMTLFNGLMCAAGIEEGCKGAQLAQGHDGRWWRSPRVVDREGVAAKVSFSRDMAAGVMVYLAASGDKDAATKWLHWIKGNRACMLENPTGVGGDCLRRAPFYRYCRDDGSDQRCAMLPGSWNLLAAVWNKLGLPLDEEMAGLPTGDLTIEKLSALFDSEGGTDMYLQGVTAFLYQIINRSRASTRGLTRILIKAQPNNPFYMYLHDGPTDEVARKLLDVCTTDGDHRKHQWSWQRNTAEQAWKENMGWDCMFMAKLVLQDIAPCTDVPNNIIREGSNFSRGKVWNICTGYSLRFQSDGNLVLYNQGGRPIWSANTAGKGSTKLIMQADGNFVIYNAHDKAVWSTRTHGNPHAFLAIQNDGNVVIYPDSGKCTGSCPFATDTVGK